MGDFFDHLLASAGRSAGKTFGVVVAAVVLIVIGYWGYLAVTGEKRPSSPNGSGDVTVESPRRPIFSRENNSTSSSGDKPDSSVSDAPSGTITVTDTSSPDTSRFRQSVQVEAADQWFPDWRLAKMKIRVLSDDGKVVFTPSPRPLFSWRSVLEIGVGGYFLGGGISGVPPVGLRVASSPFKIADRFYVGAYVHFPPKNVRQTRIGLKIGTTIRRNLQVSVGISHNRDIGFSVTYRF